MPVALALFGALGACSVQPSLPNLRAIYEYTAEIDPAFRRPIITIPGTLGSRLRTGRDGPFLWGGPDDLSADPDDPEGARMIALPIGDGTRPLSVLRDGIRPAGVLRKANASFLGAVVEEEIYDGIVKSLNAGGFEFSLTRQEELERLGRNPGSFEFPYDWRRDIVEAARELHDFIERKAQQVSDVRTQRYGSAPKPEAIRFDVVAHSMGSLVLRYYLMYGDQELPADGSLPELTWAGAKRIACAVFIAPPNLGSISAFENLVNGKSLGPLLPTYPAALLSTHHSIYQLMPRDRHSRALFDSVDGAAVGSLYDVELWDRFGWGLLAQDADIYLQQLLPEISDPVERRRRAKAHLRQLLSRAEQFHRAMDRPVTPRATDLFLVVGTGLDTPASLIVDSETGEVGEGTYEEGDGIVLRASALMDERQGSARTQRRNARIRYRTVLLLPDEHVELTKNPVFADNLLYWLLDGQRTRVAGDGIADAAIQVADNVSR